MEEPGSGQVLLQQIDMVWLLSRQQRGAVSIQGRSECLGVQGRVHLFRQKREMVPSVGQYLMGVRLVADLDFGVQLVRGAREFGSMLVTYQPLPCQLQGSQDGGIADDENIEGLHAHGCGEPGRSPRWSRRWSSWCVLRLSDLWHGRARGVTDPGRRSRWRGGTGSALLWREDFVR